MPSSFLNPHDRGLLFEAFRPPEGYTLTLGIGTTYSLDLNALLAAPLAFTFFDWEEQDEPTPDPLPLLEALRRHSDRIHLFCQAGQIQVPPKQQRLYGYLEKSVVDVRPIDRHGVFHPKIWVFRFESPEGPPKFRLLCSSRNMTFDRSWDCILALDGEPVDRERAIAVNHPLANFVKWLPSRAVRPLEASVSGAITTLAEELRRVRWELPDGIEDLQFWPMGMDEKGSWPFGRDHSRLLAVSPFVDEKAAKKLASSAAESYFVGRLDELSMLTPSALKPYKAVFFMNPAIELEQASEQEQATLLRGLHAKLYIAEAGWNAHVWMGSANATTAAMQRNVEFLVELIGKKSRLGIDSFMDGEGTAGGFRSLLCPFDISKPAAAIDQEQKKLEQKLDHIARDVAALRFQATVSQEGETFRFQLLLEETSEWSVPPEAKLLVWPITLPDLQGKAIGPALPMADFGLVAFDSLTSFFGFDLSLSENGKSARARFALNVPLIGAPEDRRERILKSILGNRQQVLRFLLFLLAESGTEGGGDLLLSPRMFSTVGGDSSEQAPWPLFESLMRTLDRNPKRLDQVARLIEELRSTPEGRDLLPPSFDSVWEPIWSVRKGLTI